MDPDYSSWHMKIGNEELCIDYNLGDDIVEIPETLVITGPIVEATFGSNLMFDDMETYSNTVILCPINDDTAFINEEALKLLPGDVTIYI